MVASTASTAGDAPPCPDPSVHEKHHKLSEAASTAALYVTNPERNAATSTSSGRESVLGPDGKLSSRSAATSLKYAKNTELPSFPSVGLGSNSNNAGAAALLAKDYKMKDLWQPEMSNAGSKAALLAHKSGGKLDLWEPSASSAGNSAAALAMRNLSLSPQVDRGYTETGKNNSLLAATMVHNQGRARSGSTPTPKTPANQQSQITSKGALNAATVSHRASVRAGQSNDGWNSEANQAARVTHIGEHMKPEMFGDRPPVEPEIQEQQRNAALRASAVSMAKQMYEYKEEKRLEAEAAEAVGGAEFAHRRNASIPTQPDLKEEAMRYIHLQDAAHKLAQERLAKVDKDFEAGRYREYYGYGNHQTKQSKLTSVRGRRRRANSEGTRDAEDSSDDETQARRIRQQMSQLSTNAGGVDDKKRDDDRAKLLAAAEARVHARMHDMDEKVFQDTGKVSQSMMDDWEAKARQKAEKDRLEREQHPGQTHIGGGKFMSQADIEAIAASRLQSTFDEINDTAEKRRARDAELARERDAAQTQRMEEKMQNDQQKAEFRRIKDADKAAARKDKEERKAAKKAEQEQAKIRKSEDKKLVITGVVAAGAAEYAEEHHIQETQETPETQNKRTSRFGTLGRFTSKLRKRDDGGEKRIDTTTKRESAVQTAPVVVADAEEPEERAVKTEAVDEDHDDEEEGHEAAEAAVVVPVIVAADDAVVGDAEGDKEAVEPVEESRQAEYLAPVTDAEPTGHFMDVIPSPGIMTKPDLERHISMIQHSDDDSDDLSDDGDDEDDDEREPVSPLAPEEREENDIVPVTTHSSIPLTGSATATAVVAAGVPHSSEEASAANSTAEPKAVAGSSTAPAPAVKTTTEKEASKSKETKRSGGFFSKLVKRRSKNEGKLSEASAPVPAPAAAPASKEDPMIPVTNTTTGIAAEPSHAPKLSTATATTASTADPKVSSTLDDGESISSFRRHAQEPVDPDDVSSSGADEEEVTRGRTGRFASKLGFKGKDKITDDTTADPTTTTTTTTTIVTSSTGGTTSTAVDRKASVSNDEETFEEARDHFDEGLAPAPAFGGSAKSTSPARGTKFQEEL